MSDHSKTKLILYIDSLWISPYALSSYVALREKGFKLDNSDSNLTFELREEDLFNKGEKKDEHLAHTIFKKIPTLEVKEDGKKDSFIITQSNAIAEYLDEKYPNQGVKLFPINIEQRATAREIMGWIRSDMLPIRDERSTSSMLYQSERKKLEPLSAIANKAAEKLIGMAKALIPEEGQNLFGDWCLADTDLAIMINRILPQEGDKEEIKFKKVPIPEKVRLYANHQLSRSSVQEFLKGHENKEYQAYNY